MKLIDEDALVAEIEKLNPPFYPTLAEKISYQDATKDCINIIYTLEVKEVDLEKEYKDFVEEDPVYNKLVNSIVGKAIAKHFFELGVSCQINNINIEEVKAAAKAWSEDDENTRGCDYIGAVVAERAFVACAEWLINKAQKGEGV